MTTLQQWKNVIKVLKKSIKRNRKSTIDNLRYNHSLLERQCLIEAHKQINKLYRESNNVLQ
jgi:hypothetical protein